MPSKKTSTKRGADASRWQVLAGGKGFALADHDPGVHVAVCVSGSLGQRGRVRVRVRADLGQQSGRLVVVGAAHAHIASVDWNNPTRMSDAV